MVTLLDSSCGPECRRDDATGAIRWYLYDGFGSILAEVDPLGNLTASRKYDACGLVRAGDSGTMFEEWDAPSLGRGDVGGL